MWQKGHVPTAKWVDFKNVQASDLPKDKDRTLIFYCANEK
jgi:rhodanese-related sulfurtransferase